MTEETVLDLHTEEPFSADALEQVRLAEQVKTAQFLSSRSDLRGKPIFAFSNGDVTEADCAFSIEKVYDNYILGLHIADADEFVCEGSPLDIEAASRFKTFTTADGRKFRMLPDKLYSDVCSFRTDADRLALSIFLEITPDGALVDISIDTSVVRVTQICLHDEVDALYTSADRSVVLALRDKYACAQKAFDMLYTVGAALYANRHASGSPSLFTYQTECKRKKDGKIISMMRRSEPDSAALTTEIRLFAGIAIGKYLQKCGIPCLYTCHKALSGDKLKYLYGLIDADYDASLSDECAQAKLARLINDMPESEFLGAELYSSLEPVYWSPDPDYNSFYAVTHSVEFAHPTIRYSDLLMLRILKQCVKAEFNPSNLNISQMKRHVEATAEMCNKKSASVNALKDSVISALQSRLLRSDTAFKAKYIGNGLIVLPWGLIAECRFSREPDKLKTVYVIADDAEKPHFVSRETFDDKK